MKVCAVNACGRPVIAKGYCTAHYQRFKKYGSPQADVSVGDKSGSRNPHWRGGLAKLPDGRVLVYAPDHPFAGVAGTYVLRSRLVMEKSLGRFLTLSEIVHHKNSIIDDDRIENLEIMNPSQHGKFHYEHRTKNTIGKRLT